MNTALSLAVDRLEAVLVEETEALKASRQIDFADITARKNQSLLELTRLNRSMEAAGGYPEASPRLRRLADVISENQRVLDLHVRASNEIAALISRTIADEESDGTYEAALGRRGAGAVGDLS